MSFPIKATSTMERITMDVCANGQILPVHPAAQRNPLLLEGCRRNCVVVKKYEHIQLNVCVPRSRIPSARGECLCIELSIDGTLVQKQCLGPDTRKLLKHGERHTEIMDTAVVWEAATNKWSQFDHITFMPIQDVLTPTTETPTILERNQAGKLKLGTVSVVANKCVHECDTYDPEEHDTGRANGEINTAAAKPDSQPFVMSLEGGTSVPWGPTFNQCRKIRHLATISYRLIDESTIAPATPSQLGKTVQLPVEEDSVISAHNAGEITIPSPVERPHGPTPSKASARLFSGDDTPPFANYQFRLSTITEEGPSEERGSGRYSEPHTGRAQVKRRLAFDGTSSPILPTPRRYLSISSIRVSSMDQEIVPRAQSSPARLSSHATIEQAASPARTTSSNSAVEDGQIQAESFCHTAHLHNMIVDTFDKERQALRAQREAMHVSFQAEIESFAAQRSLLLQLQQGQQHMHCQAASVGMKKRKRDEASQSDEAMSVKKHRPDPKTPRSSKIPRRGRSESRA